MREGSGVKECVCRDAEIMDHRAFGFSRVSRTGIIEASNQDNFVALAGQEFSASEIDPT